MKSYPKVPRYDHNAVPPELYNADDLILLEKTDGQNSRIFLYDERYQGMYSEEFIDEYNPKDGEVYIGTKTSIQGKLSDDTDEFKGNFKRLLSYLRENLNIKELETIHTEYNSPIVLFGEHMIRHSLNYGYKESPPPAFIGFDAFIQKEYTPQKPSNPYNETFEGFLDFDEVQNIFQRIGLESIPVVENIDASIDPETVEVPTSNYAEIQAEGVVFRSDNLNRRSKNVTEEFEERNKKAWGIREDQAETGEELIAAQFLTNGRIRKYIHKTLQKNENIHATEIAETIVYDIWVEEWREISNISIEVTPHKLYDYTLERVEEILDKMETNAHLNNSELLDLWDAHSDIDPTTTGSFNIDSNEIQKIENNVQSYESTENGLIEELLDTDIILTLAKDIADQEDKEIGNWTIPQVKEEVTELFWTENLKTLANLKIQYTPTKINELLVEKTSNAIMIYTERNQTQNKADDTEQTYNKDVLDGHF